MEYGLYFLQFDTPVHFGGGENGEDLAQGSLTYRSDTLFSAVCSELALSGQLSQIERLYALCSQANLLLSDLFPYTQEEGEEPFLFLPKPLLPEKLPHHIGISYNQYISLLDQDKQLHQLRYVRASELDDYVSYMCGEQDSFSGELYELELGRGQVRTRVNHSEETPVPYYVYEFTFKENAGLYGILGYEEEKDRDVFLQILSLLGLNGIGGKRSSGYGKFHFWQDPEIYTDKIKLSTHLNKKKAAQYMAISSVLPASQDTGIVKKGQYRVQKRSGFITPEDNSLHKRKNVYMLEAGSCFPEKIQGRIVDISVHDQHPVWRNGKGIYVGL